MSMWDVIKPEIGQRWPEWEPTPADDRDWERVLGGERLEDVQEVLFRVRTKYSSRIPQLKWVVVALRAVKDERKPDARGVLERMSYPERLRRRWIHESPVEAALLERMSDAEILCDEARLIYEKAKRLDLGDYGPRGGITAMRYWQWQQELLYAGVRTIPVRGAPYDEQSVDAMWAELQTEETEIANA